MGLANQTTMLRDETMAIGKLLEKTMMQKHGPAAIKEHFMVMDTICDATQVPDLPCFCPCSCNTDSASVPCGQLVLRLRQGSVSLRAVRV